MAWVYNLVSVLIIGVGVYQTLFDTCKQNFECLFNGWILGTIAALVILNFGITILAFFRVKQIRKQLIKLLVINSVVTIIYYLVILIRLYSFQTPSIDALANYSPFVWYLITNNLLLFKKDKASQADL